MTQGEGAATPSASGDAGRTFWRVEKATRASFIVDADAYFQASRQAMLKARHRIMLIGWDFDARINLSSERLPGEPRTLGEFVLWLVERRPGLEVFLLRWDIGAIRTLFHGATLFTLLRWVRHKRIFLRLDGATPVGASHHHKIAVVDDCLAFCGGIDMTSNRWDTPEHLDDNAHRTSPGGAPYAPWHDATTALEGPVAAALAELARDRWRRAGGQALSPVEAGDDCWPALLPCHFKDVSIGISRTQPRTPEHEPIWEIEESYLALIASARRFIYAESQYFASRRIAEALSKRLAEPDGPEVVLINPLASHGWLEPIAMDTARARLYRALQKLHPAGRFRIYHPRTRAGQAIYVHAKILIVDDRVLHVGSSNMNNRSMRLDTECDVTIDAGIPGNEAASPTIAAIRDGLLGEHLGCEPAEVARRIAESGSLIGAVEALRGPGRSLYPYEVPDLGSVEKWLADNEILDPEGPEEIFESFTKRGLLRRLRHGLAARRLAERWARVRGQANS